MSVTVSGFGRPALVLSQERLAARQRESIGSEVLDIQADRITERHFATELPNQDIDARSDCGIAHSVNATIPRAADQVGVRCDGVRIAIRERRLHGEGDLSGNVRWTACAAFHLLYGL